MIHKRVIKPKPLIALGEFWRPVVAHIESADPRSRRLVTIAATVEEAVRSLGNGNPAGIRSS
jgi:hypothetical protein